MGTNFYKYRIKKNNKTVVDNIKEKFEEIINNISKNGFINEYDIVCLNEKLDKCKIEKIHLGKRSGGWQFIWNHNDKKYYQDNLESIKEFLNDGDGWIEDEYGERFTPEQLLNDKIGACLYNDPERYINGHQYDERENYYCAWKNCGQYEYTTSDGLRFSTSTDFS
jgi:hypothetical protein